MLRSIYLRSSIDHKGLRNPVDRPRTATSLPLGAYTGMRLGEVVSLRWERIDWTAPSCWSR